MKKWSGNSTLIKLQAAVLLIDFFAVHTYSFANCCITGESSLSHLNSVFFLMSQSDKNFKIKRFNEYSFASTRLFFVRQCYNNVTELLIPQEIA
jgi:hypothetical protein